MPSAHDNQWIRSGTAFWVEPDPKKGCAYGGGWCLARLTFCIFQKRKVVSINDRALILAFTPFLKIRVHQTYNPGRFDGS